MIYIITGKPGHGKTAYMTKWARSVLKRGERIYSNVKFFPDRMFSKKQMEKYFSGFNIEGDVNEKTDRDDSKKRILYWQHMGDWVHFTNGVVFCQEGLRYFNARKWESLPDTMQQKFTEHRKDKIDLVFDIQHYTFIEKTLRVLADRFINVELKIGSSKFKKSIIPRISRVTEIDLPTMNRCENLGIDVYNMSRQKAEEFNIQPLWREWFWIRSKIFTWYDSSERVCAPRPEPLIHFERSCPTCGKSSISHF